jgi:signal transduction histidine kinase
MLTDITEVTRLREQVALKRNLESLGEMSAGLAHEFKNSLAALQGYAQFMLSLGLEGQAHNAAGALLDEVRNLTGMITSFLNFARPRALQRSSVQIDQLLLECCDELEPLARERQVEVILKTEAMEATVDERMLRQALLNIIRNAIEAIGADKNTRTVSVSVHSTSNEPGADSFCVEVRDTGPGIEANVTQKIFLPFFSTKAQGHGIGLALAHRVITEHGGNIAVSNISGSGAMFRITLPKSYVA